VTVGDDNSKGIYLRGVVETYEIQQIQVQVSPVYANKDSPTQNKNKLDLEIRVRLESKCRWITVPDFLLLNNGGRGFNVQVDTSSLAPGFHFSEIIAFDTNQPGVGPLFKIPVTICKPERQSVSSSSSSMSKSIMVQSHLPESYRFENVLFSPGTIHRRFVHVPYSSNFAELVVKCERRATPARLIVHLMVKTH
jgi:tripeptidyl-peptidase-2